MLLWHLASSINGRVFRLGPIRIQRIELITNHQCDDSFVQKDDQISLEFCTNSTGGSKSCVKTIRSNANDLVSLDHSRSIEQTKRLFKRRQHGDDVAVQDWKKYKYVIHYINGLASRRPEHVKPFTSLPRM